MSTFCVYTRLTIIGLGHLFRRYLKSILSSISRFVQNFLRYCYKTNIEIYIIMCYYLTCFHFPCLFIGFTTQIIFLFCVHIVHFLQSSIHNNFPENGLAKVAAFLFLESRKLFGVVNYIYFLRM